MGSSGHREGSRGLSEREDPSQDFHAGPEEKTWDEEDGLFDDEEIVVGQRTRRQPLR